jgi:hypothetical protein
MCDVCNNNAIRNYTHSRNKRHLRLLMKLMKIKKNTNFYTKTNGHFKPNF